MNIHTRFYITLYALLNVINCVCIRNRTRNNVAVNLIRLKTRAGANDQSRDHHRYLIKYFKMILTGIEESPTFNWRWSWCVTNGHLYARRSMYFLTRAEDTPLIYRTRKTLPESHWKNRKLRRVLPATSNVFERAYLKFNFNSVSTNWRSCTHFEIRIRN